MDISTAWRKAALIACRLFTPWPVASTAQADGLYESQKAPAASMIDKVRNIVLKPVAIPFENVVFAPMKGSGWKFKFPAS